MQGTILKKKIIIDGLLVNYYQSDSLDSDGVVVFLHGWGVNAVSLRPIWQGCQNFVALDWPGFGESQIPSSVWNVAMYADFLSIFFEKKKIKNPILVGHSFGGRVIVKYCSSGSQEAQKIILIDSAGIKDSSWKAEFLSRLSSAGNSLRKVPGAGGLVDKVGKKLQSDDYRLAGDKKGIFKKVVAEDLQEDMKKIEVPTAIIWGEDDQDTPVSDGQKIHQLVANSKYYVIEGAGHYPFVDKYQDFMKVFNREVNGCG